MLVCESCVKKGKIIYLCKYNFTICSLNLYVRSSGTTNRTRCCFQFILVWFIPVSQSSRYEGYEKWVHESNILTSPFVRVYLFETIDLKSGTWSLNNLDDIPRT
jgi:hypothetical protein